MERLTGKELAEGTVICIHDEDDCNDSCMYSRCKWVEKAIVRLKEYEETGLDPEQSYELKERDTEKEADTNSCDEYTHYKCPNCGYVHLIIYSDGCRSGRLPNFCDKCGQRLKRSEVE